jgi:phosphatidylinositol-3-phosphatase
LQKLLILLTLQFILIGCTIPTKTPLRPAAENSGQLQKLHATMVVLVVLENKSRDEVLEYISPTKKTFLGDLAKDGAYLSNYYAVAHPSQPNYMALVSGSVAGVVGDFPPEPIDRHHLGSKDMLQSWRVYAENYPGGPCDPNIGDKPYASKHVPFVSFKDVREDSNLCKHIIDFTKFHDDVKASSLPSFSLVIPNLDNDAHDKPLGDADQWLKANFGKLIEDPDFKRNVLLIITFDENDTKWTKYFGDNDNKVFTLFWGDDVLPGKVEDAVYNHYDLLRTIEAIFNLPTMATDDGNARPILGVWK